MRNINQIFATPDLLDVIKQARAAHSPKAGVTYSMLRRLEAELTEGGDDNTDVDLAMLMFDPYSLEDNTEPEGNARDE